MKLHSAPLDMYFSKSTFSLKLPEFGSKPLTIEIVHGSRQESEKIYFGKKGKKTSQAEQNGTNFRLRSMFFILFRLAYFSQNFFSTMVFGRNLKILSLPKSDTTGKSISRGAEWVQISAP